LIDDGASGIWTPTGLSGCVCLDLLASDYSHDSRSDYPLIFGAIGSRGKIKLTDFGDCSRIIGDDNNVYGLDGDDAMLTVGDSNRVTGGDGNDVMSSVGDGNSLYADAGDDLLTAEGSGGHINGGRGEDICTDLGDNTFFNEVYDDDPGAYQDCESCSGPDGAILECETGEPY